MARRYEMAGRAAAMQRTRDAILDAAVELFAPAWFDEVTVADVARAAGVSQQTVVNHFGSKIGLYIAAVSERFAPALAALRSRAVPGDVASIVETAITDYETSGDATFRLVALAGRVPELDQVVTTGHRAHREWVEHVFAPQLKRMRGRRRERTVVLLTTSLDVLTWKALRRDQGLEPDATADHLRVLVEGVLGAA
jgi:AcrR family transcriptional regulator